jgi:serine/threonine protein kinase
MGIEIMEVRFVDGQVEQYEKESSFSGAQGDLYRSKDGKSLVKLYTYKDNLTRQKQEQEHVKRLDTLINELNPLKGDSYWNTFFTWPEKRVVSPSVGFRMRYVDGMKLMEHFFLQQPFLRLAPEERGWFIGRVASAMKLVTAANRLSTMGLCYADFSGKNVMADPFAGSAVLIDCDSLTVPGQVSAVVNGTPEFRAPELVTGDLKVPNLHTDRHALAVLLYRWFFLRNPFLGDRVYSIDDAQDELLRYGKMATYIEHPTDKSNRVANQSLKASTLGKEIASLFERTFVKGLQSPWERAQSAEWQIALYHIYDQIVPCSNPDCWWHAFVARTEEPLVCPACQTPLQQPAELPFVYLLQHRGGSNPDEYLQGKSKASHSIVGWPGRQLYQWHARPDASPVYTSASIPDLQPWASFFLDLKTGYWSLKNVSKETMYYQLPAEAGTRQWRVWAPGDYIWLIPNMQLQFGPAPTFFRALILMEKTLAV